MTTPGSGQSVHLMTFMDVLRVRWNMRRKERRNVRELQLFTTDDLRRLYQAMREDYPVRVGLEGVVDRRQLVAEIRWRIFREWASYFLVLFLSAVAAIASVIAAAEGWK